MISDLSVHQHVHGYTSQRGGERGIDGAIGRGPPKLNSFSSPASTMPRSMVIQVVVPFSLWPKSPCSGAHLPFSRGIWYDSRFQPSVRIWAWRKRTALGICARPCARNSRGRRPGEHSRVSASNAQFGRDVVFAGHLWLSCLVLS